MSKTSKSSSRGLIILAFDLILFFLLINWMPFSPQENRSLALLIFVGILWLTEAFNITITSLMVPIFAILLNVLSTKAAFAPFSESIIFMFFGGFVIAAVLNLNKIDLWSANHVIRLAKGNLKRTVLYLFIACIIILGCLSYFFWTTWWYNSIWSIKRQAVRFLPLFANYSHKI